MPSGSPGPHDRETFPDLATVEAAYVEMIAALRGSETVSLLVTDEKMQIRVKAMLEEEGVDTGGIRFHVVDYADVWFRDYGPTFVVNRKAGSLAMVNWTFNAWGEKYPALMEDTRVPLFMNREMGLPVFTPGIVLEGGSSRGEWVRHGDHDGGVPLKPLTGTRASPGRRSRRTWRPISAQVTSSG